MSDDQDIALGIAILEEVISRTTPLPWTQDPDELNYVRHGHQTVCSVNWNPHDALFISLARTWLPVLLEKYRSTAKEADDLRELVRRWEEIGEKYDIMPRPRGCACHLEEGDSPCPIHGESEVDRG